MRTIKRMFQLWAYTVSHGQLLLRSTKSDRHPTRVDIAFKDVVALRVPSVFDELSFEECSAEEIGLSSDVVQGRNVWRLLGPAFEGFVIAGAMLLREDDGEYNDPSGIYPG